uniref:terminase small subunit n=1 Tax=Alistipes sp. TaxID=1872444 RepID=UPI004055B6B6
MAANDGRSASRGAGRPRKYDPDTLSDAFDRYAEWVQAHPLAGEKVIGDGSIIPYTVRRPMSLQGFCVFAGILPSCFRRYEAQPEEFGEVCERVRMTIEADQIEGAFANQYNPTISARILGLREGADITTNGKEIAPQGVACINVAYNGEQFTITPEDIGKE